MFPKRLTDDFRFLDTEVFYCFIFLQHPAFGAKFIGRAQC